MAHRIVGRTKETVSKINFSGKIPQNLTSELGCQGSHGLGQQPGNCSRAVGLRTTPYRQGQGAAGPPGRHLGNLNAS